MKAKWKGRIREAGYEALFFLNGLAEHSLQPTLRNAEELVLWRSDPRLEEERLRRLGERGLVEGGGDGADGILRLTAMGRAVFEGGRDVEEAWGRGWDGRWRMLVFDIPRGAAPARTRFWRWLRANHFGRLQGSVWIHPDPFSGIEEVLRNSGLDSTMVVMMTGEVAGWESPREVAGRVWDFEAINRAYRQYTGFGERILRQAGSKAPSPARLKEILREDRKRWWNAVRRDPLLPAAVLPEPYEGTGAWKSRQKLLRTLGKALKSGTRSA